MGAANLALATAPARDGAIPAYLRGWAQISGSVLRVFGEKKVEVVSHTVSSDRFTVDIKRGCDALQPTVLFISAVLASPVGLLSKVPGLLIGFLFLMAMNLVRVISLFYIGIHIPRWFDTAHHDIWQATFIILSISAWALWAIWAVGKTSTRADAS